MICGIKSDARIAEPFDEKITNTIKPNGEDIFLMKTTAYCSGTITATGHPVREGVVGVNKKYLCSYGGTEWCCAIWSADGKTFYGYYDNFDCGADAENQNLIDVYKPTLEECQDWMAETNGQVIVQFIRADG